ncbi:MAG: cell division protein FtsZ, partial [Pseudomonadota bacterium]
EVAKELGILTVAVVTKPFPFEGTKRTQIATRGIEELANQVDSLITIPNEKLITVLGKDTSLLEAFRAANDVLLGAVQGIAELITCPGLINVDFADVRTVMSEMGMAMMGSGTGLGNERAREAAEAAISSPLLEDINITGARGILVNVTAGPNLGMNEIAEVGSHIEDIASDDATVVVGTVIDESMEDKLRVTLVATGLGVQNVSSSPAKVALVEPVVEVTKIEIEPPAKNTQPVRQEAAEVDEKVSMDGGSYNEDLLDIPAFLRRQAD